MGGTIPNSNNCCQGPTKSITQWKKSFQAIKGNIKRVASEVYQSRHATGGGQSRCKDLTDLQEKLMRLLSKVTVEGVDVPEAVV